MRLFAVRSGDRVVPAALWLPAETSGPVPLVLLGHGGSQHKTSPGPMEVVRRVVEHHSCAALAIDGPVHGARRADGGRDVDAVRRDAVRAFDDPGTVPSMTADWRAVLAAVDAMDDVSLGPIGYRGVSMGTLYGLPLIAEEPRIVAAALGLWGLGGEFSAMDAPVRAACPAVRCPVLFLAQESDEFFPLAGVTELFGALGTDDRRLHLNVGAHGEVPTPEWEASVDFVVSRLT
ncbi:hypothetical protein Val02_61100 [Virgisporangium aliadipatigenens]|uniref:Alpha/beta hydrolase n=1 Tax=Virgisporangium aliadipatigenens TaxID=741659 RepID=A0A8J4DSY4_9ACTN|nr:hypothetical protein [Virgisporangium aliadipatigenens]GIJ49224.1 hypothetical protein Val02_61100 [Virgisporangium aliadipatigenens]